ncbi:hypothetical protein [Aliivibrio wodanis]|uniref:hypothetical protein n=1 Tax=Aliivibrio wodanis TaxID=80852 RepID=UPI00406D3A63
MIPMNEKCRAAKNAVEMLRRMGCEVMAFNLNFNRPVITISNPIRDLMLSSSLIKSSHKKEQKLIRITRYKGCVVTWESSQTTEAMIKFILGSSI